MSSSVSFLVWCAVFLALTALAHAEPLTVLMSITVGWPLVLTARR